MGRQPLDPSRERPTLDTMEWNHGLGVLWPGVEELAAQATFTDVHPKGVRSSIPRVPQVECQEATFWKTGVAFRDAVGTWWIRYPDMTLAKFSGLPGSSLNDDREAMKRELATWWRRQEEEQQQQQRGGGEEAAAAGSGGGGGVSRSGMIRASGCSFRATAARSGSLVTIAAMVKSGSAARKGAWKMRPPSPNPTSAVRIVMPTACHPRPWHGECRGSVALSQCWSTWETRARRLARSPRA